MKREKIFDWENLKTKLMKFKYMEQAASTSVAIGVIGIVV